MLILFTVVYMDLAGHQMVAGSNINPAVGTYNIWKFYLWQETLILLSANQADKRYKLTFGINLC